MANRNEMIKKGTKGQKTMTVKPEEEKKGEKMKETKKKETVSKRAGEEDALKKLMAETTKKLNSLATDIVVLPTKKYNGWKLGSRRLAAIYPRKVFFHLWVFVYNSSGNHVSIEKFPIKATSKDIGVVITGLIAQVKKNYGILKAADEKAAKPAPKKEAKPAPKKEIKKAPKKEAKKTAK